MNRIKNLIVGGGFSGLYLGTLLDDAVVLEASERRGGLLASFRTSHGFHYDVGGHVYTTTHPDLTKILKAAGATFHEQRHAYFDYELAVPYPIQYHAHMLKLEPRATNPLTSYASLSELFIHEFGEDFYQQILRPFNRRVWSTDPSQLAADWVAGRVGLMSDKREGWGPNSSFFYAPGDDILNVVTTLSNIHGTQIVYGAKVWQIDYINKLVWANVNGTRTYYEYENIFDTSGLLLHTTSWTAFLPHNDVLTIGVGFDRPLDCVPFHWWYNGVYGTSPIHRITLLSRYHDRVAPNGCDSLLIEIPVNETVENMGMNPLETGASLSQGINEMLRLANFHNVASFSLRNIVDTAVIRSRGYPIPIRGHRKIVAAVRKAMQPHNAYLVGRWGAHGYYNLNHIIDDAKAAVSVAIDKNNPHDYQFANYYYKEAK